MRNARDHDGDTGRSWSIRYKLALSVVLNLSTIIVLGLIIRSTNTPPRILYILLSDPQAKVGQIWIVVAAMRKLRPSWSRHC